MNHGSLFSGIGGFDLAAEWMGWENQFHCEWNEFGQRVLHHYWPKAITYEDITKTDFTIWRGRVDVLTGGFPCQPYSLAGKRLGKEDERHLWPEMLRAIREIQPRWVVGENVLGLVNWNGGLVFDEVQADLEAQGYEVQPYVLPACAVNAPHRRDRVWFVAFNASNSNSDGLLRCNGKHEVNSGERGFNALSNTEPSSWNGSDTNTRCERCNDGGDNRKERHIQTNIGITEKNQSEWFGRECRTSEAGAVDAGRTDSDTYSERHTSRGESQEAKGDRSANNGEPKEWVKSPERTDGLSRFLRNASNPSSESGERMRPEQRESSEQEQGQPRRTRCEVGNDKYATDTECSGGGEILHDVQREQPNGSIAYTFDEQTDWSIFPTVSPICHGDDGLSTELDGITFSKWRQESVKAGGNAIVPQVALQIFKAIQKYEQGCLH